MHKLTSLSLQRLLCSENSKKEESAGDVSTGLVVQSRPRGPLSTNLILMDEKPIPRYGNARSKQFVGLRHTSSPL